MFEGDSCVVGMVVVVMYDYFGITVIRFTPSAIYIYNHASESLSNCSDDAFRSPQRILPASLRKHSNTDVCACLLESDNMYLFSMLLTGLLR